MDDWCGCHLGAFRYLERFRGTFRRIDRILRFKGEDYGVGKDLKVLLEELTEFLGLRVKGC